MHGILDNCTGLSFFSFVAEPCAVKDFESDQFWKPLS